MTLTDYFQNLIERVESSTEITNAGKDDAGFYKPRKTILLQKLNLLKDLHEKPTAKAMVKTAWNYVVEEIPPEWLVLPNDLKSELRKILN
ncbi:MAG: hypothetical protein K2Q26_06940 [Bdellovibrionales bacterium]|nr:hypothetical protein [Bdellovibrionales bacterium]